VFEVKLAKKLRDLFYFNDITVFLPRKTKSLVKQENGKTIYFITRQNSVQNIKKRYGQNFEVVEKFGDLILFCHPEEHQRLSF